MSKELLSDFAREKLIDSITHEIGFRVLTTLNNSDFDDENEARNKVMDTIERYILDERVRLNGR